MLREKKLKREKQLKLRLQNKIVLNKFYKLKFR